MSVVDTQRCSSTTTYLEAENFAMHDSIFFNDVGDGNDSRGQDFYLLVAEIILILWHVYEVANIKCLSR